MTGPDVGTLHGRFLARVAAAPDAVAVCSGDDAWTYGELDHASAAVAGGLWAAGVRPGDRVGIAVRRDRRMVAAMLGVLRAGAAYVPIDPDYPADRVRFMLEDAAMRVLLHSDGLAAALPVGGVPALDVDALVAAGASAPDVAVAPADPCYAMFTSGSSGRPKCAVNLHQGIVALVDAMAVRPGLQAGDVVAQLISLSHDMSVADVFLALSVGAAVRVVPREQVVDGAALAGVLARDPTTYVSATPSTFRMLVERDWRPARPPTVLMAGEPLPPDLVGPLVERGCTVWNGYGMTEASVYTTITRCLPGQPVTIGGPVEGTPVYLLDDALQPVAAGEAGELWHGGIGTGAGYLGRPELSAERFVADPFRAGQDDGGRAATMYRSGDLARWDAEGRLHYLGRADRQVKIRGFRVEPGEIEAALNAHPDVVVAVVDARPGPGGDRQLVAWVVPRGEPVGLAAVLRAALSARLPEWMVPSRFVRIDALPRTPMGKIDRRALPEPPAERDPALGEPVAPEGEDEAAIAGLFAELLGLPLVGRHDDFFALGGDSLLAARLSFALERSRGRTVPAHAVLVHRTPAALAARLDAGRQAGDAALAPIPSLAAGASAPLSATQRRLWFLQQLDPTRVDYNVNLVFHLDGPVDPRALQAALQRVVDRQHALRTVYERSPDGPRQRVVDQRVRLPLVALDHLDPAEAEDECRAAAGDLFRRPFALDQGPVARFSLVRLGPERHQLLACVHHIVIDGWSVGVLRDELVAALRDPADAGPPPATQVPDVAAWEEELLADEEAGLLAWWTERLAPDGLPPAPVSLPADRPPGASPRLDGALQWLELDASLSARVDALARRQGATPFVVLMAALTALLGAETGRPELALGTVVAGRDRAELEHLVGFFSNTLVLPLPAGPGLSFEALVRAVRDRAHDALAHARLPFDRLVAALAPERTPASQPLVRTCFILQSPPTDTVQVGPLALRVEEVDNGTAPFDLTLQLWRSGATFRGNLLYRTECFDRGTMQAVAEGLVALLETAVADPSRPLSSLPAPLRDRVEEAARSVPGVRDAACFTRPRADGSVERCLAVVAEQPLADEPLRRALDGGPSVAAIEQLANLPRTADGAVDRAALAAGALARAPRPARLHLDELLPGAGTQAGADGADGPRHDTGVDAATAGPALRVGPPLDLPEDAPRLLPDVLRRAARVAPSRGVTTLPDDGGARGERFLSWPELLRRAERVAAGLAERDLAPGAPVVVQVADSEQLLVVLWGCFLGGQVPVPMATAAHYALGVAAVDRVIGVWKSLHRPPVIVDDGPAEGLATLGEPGMRLVPAADLQASAAPFTPPDQDPDDLVLLLLTSGSTGVPKAVRHHHRTIHAMLAAYGRAIGAGADDVFLNWLGLDHVAPLFMCHLSSVWWAAANVNGPLAPFLQDPTVALDWAHRHRATSTFLPNFAFGLMADAAVDVPAGRWDLSPFARVTNGGEPIVPATTRRFMRIMVRHGLPEHAMIPIWGMSETCSATILSMAWRAADTADDDPFTACGAPIAGFELRVADAAGATLRDGETGRLLVRGAQILSGYHERPDADAESFDADGWFDTGDLAFVGPGGLVLTGRAKDVLIVNGVNYYSHEIEAVVEAVDGVPRSFCAACPVRQPGDQTDRLAVFVAPDADVVDDPERLARLLREVRAAVTRGVGIAPSWVVPVARGDIPKTEIGKIQRPRLRKRFEAGELATEARRGDLLLENERTVPGWFSERCWTPAPGRPGPVTRRLVAICPDGQAPVGLALSPGDRVVALGDPLPELDADTDVAWLAAAEPLAVWEQVRILPDGPRLFVAAPRAYALDATERPDPAAAALTGLLMALPHERPGLGLRLFDPGDADPGVVLAAERAITGGPVETAWRGGRRFAPGLRVSDPGTLPVGPHPLTTGAPVVLVGGLGGIGQLLLPGLVAQGAGPLLIVGRTAEADLAPPARSVLARLRGDGHDVAVAVAGLGDAQALSAAFADAEQRWGRPAGAVVHLAGTMPTVPLGQLDHDELVATLAPGLPGSQHLAALVRARPGCAFVDFSSANARLGGFGVGAYTAACRADEAVAAALRADGHPAWSIAWSRWEGIGLTADVPGGELARRRGYLPVTPGPGLASLHALLRRPPADHVVGLDPTRPAVRRHHVDLPAVALQAPAPSAGDPAVPAGDDAPGSAIEAQVAAVWARALGRDQVGRDASFFELGGHSLLLVQVQGELEERFARKLRTLDLFRFPTVRSLAAFLEEGEGGGAEQGLSRAADRAEKQREARRRAAERGRGRRGR
ncbi:MAG: amino acid adenylation domain-containing protein [Alphaproteobacteria bacterium]|nr:amino acid adenylation domain-containing protein [Alphaproteobacteria bacterium]